MEIGFVGVVIIIGIFLIWFWNSLYIIKEWERGVLPASAACCPSPRVPA